jgi:hypothetical protein
MMDLPNPYSKMSLGPHVDLEEFIMSKFELSGANIKVG